MLCLCSKYCQYCYLPYLFTFRGYWSNFQLPFPVSSSGHCCQHCQMFSWKCQSLHAPKWAASADNQCITLQLLLHRRCVLPSVVHYLIMHLFYFFASTSLPHSFTISWYHLQNNYLHWDPSQDQFLREPKLRHCRKTKINNNIEKCY